MYIFLLLKYKVLFLEQIISIDIISNIMWIIISYQYKEINTWIGVLPNTEKLLLRVLKENVTQQPSFDALLRHLYKKKILYSKRVIVPRNLHTLVTLVFIVDLTYISVYRYLNILLMETTLLKHKYIILCDINKNIPYHQNIVYWDTKLYIWLCHTEKNLFWHLLFMWDYIQTDLIMFMCKSYL